MFNILLIEIFRSTFEAYVYCFEVRIQYAREMPLGRILLERYDYINESYIIDPGLTFGSKLLFTSHIIFIQNKSLSMFDIIMSNFNL